MDIVSIVFVIYGLLLLSGAYFGYKAGSQISLIMGIVSGMVVLVGVYLLSKGEQVGLIIVAVLSAYLSVQFTIRYMKTKKIMPSGMLLGVSILVLIICLSQLF